MAWDDFIEKANGGKVTEGRRENSLANHRLSIDKGMPWTTDARRYLFNANEAALTQLRIVDVTALAPAEEECDRCVTVRDGTRYLCAIHRPDDPIVRNMVTVSQKGLVHVYNGNSSLLCGARQDGTASDSGEAPFEMQRPEDRCPSCAAKLAEIRTGDP